MAQTIDLLNVTYNDVPAVLLPKHGGGTARFTDVTPTTASDSDVANGKVYFKSDGSQSTGTASGGSSNWELIHSSTLSVNTTSTSASAAGTVSIGSSAYTSNDIIWVRIRGQRGKAAGYFYGSDAIICNVYPKNNATSTMSQIAVEYYSVSSEGVYSVFQGQYGVYAYSLNSSGTLTIRRRYNSNNTKTINDTFNIEVYKLTLPSGKTLFD